MLNMEDGTYPPLGGLSQLDPVVSNYGRGFNPKIGNLVGTYQDQC